MGISRRSLRRRSRLLASVPEWTRHSAPVRFGVGVRDGPEDADREAERGERARNLAACQADHLRPSLCRHQLAIVGTLFTTLCATVGSLRDEFRDVLAAGESETARAP